MSNIVPSTGNPEVGKADFLSVGRRACSETPRFRESPALGSQGLQVGFISQAAVWLWDSH